jgi:hypothetical protein
VTWHGLPPLHAVLAGIGIAALLAATLGEAAGQQPAAQPAAKTPVSMPVLSAEQLDTLVAPIALYPDPMLGQVLAASTYPLELVEANQWLKMASASHLQRTELMNAAKQQNWDPSVQAMVAFPEVLDRLTEDIRWTADLGNAFLAQQGGVLAAVQRMRVRAQANGKLTSTAQQTVSTATEGGQSAIQIIPADPQVIYVPYYDPSYIWGPPVWGVYPALWYPPYGWGFWPGINVGLWFGGWGWGGWGWGGWGWCPGWFNHAIFVNHGFISHFGFRGVPGQFGRGIWAHNPNHRLGVPYPNGQLNGRFGAASMASRANAMRANSGSYGMRNSFGQAARMNPGSPMAQGYRGGMQGTPRTPAPAFRGPSYGGFNHGYGGGGFRGFGGGGFHGFGGGGFHGYGGGFGGGHFGGGGMHGGGRR